ncbi:hypothetical protein PRIPAC_75476, partial [Pristionchus pacificus]
SEMIILFLVISLSIIGDAQAGLGFDANQNIRASSFDLQSISTSTFECTKDNGYDLFFGRIYKSNGEVDYKGVQNIRNAVAAGLKTVDAYMIPCLTSNCPSAERQVYIAINATKGIQFGTLWLDIEELFVSWPADKSFNRQFILDMINSASKMGQSVGIFTERDNWKSIVGDWNGASFVPLWWLSYTVESNFNGFISFGGWEKPKARQVNANLKGPCNVGVIAVSYYE